MKTLLILVFIFSSGAAFSAPEDFDFHDNTMQLGLSFTAKSFCSCVFVSENTLENCLAYASVKQVSPKLTVDYAKKKTKSTLFFFFSREA